MEQIIEIIEWIESTLSEEGVRFVGDPTSTHEIQVFFALYLTRAEEVEKIKEEEEY